MTPSLTLDNAAQAIDWYKKALGAEETARSVGTDEIMHCLKPAPVRAIVQEWKGTLSPTF